MANPYGFPTRKARPREYGQGHSGPQRTFSPGDSHLLLEIGVEEIVPQGYYGMATVHVAVRPGRPIDNGLLIPNAVLIGHLEWQNGLAGGQEDVDLTRGAVIPIGATTSINLKAEMRSAVTGEAIVAFSEIIAEATVCWETSSTQDPPMSQPSVVLTPNVFSPFYEIPLQAKAMLALGTPAAAYTTLIAEFTRINVAGAGIGYQVPDPFRNGCPIRNGVNFVRFFNTVAMEVFPTWDLW